MNASNNYDLAKTEIREVLESWQHAVLSADLPSILSHYSADIVSFDAIKALQFIGRDAYAEHWKYCMGLSQGGMIFEIHELDITASSNIAFARYLCRCGCVQESGEEQMGWMRGTVCLRKLGTEWKIVHEHLSIPFDPETGATMFDAVP